MKEYYLLKDRLEIFKKNLLNIEEIHKNKKEIFNTLDKLKEKNEREINTIYKTLEEQKMLYITPAALFLAAAYLYYEIRNSQIKKEKQNFLAKFDEINENFNLFKDIVNNYSFIKDKKIIIDKIFNSNKTLEQIKEEQNVLLEKIDKTIQKEEEQRKDASKETIAIHSLFSLIEDRVINKDNAKIVIDYFNNNFKDLDLTIDKLIDIKNYIASLSKEELEKIDNISFKDIKKTLKLEKNLEKAAELVLS